MLHFGLISETQILSQDLLCDVAANILPVVTGLLYSHLLLALEHPRKILLIAT